MITNKALFFIGFYLLVFIEDQQRLFSSVREDVLCGGKFTLVGVNVTLRLFQIGIFDSVRCPLQPKSDTCFTLNHLFFERPQLASIRQLLYCSLIITRHLFPPFTALDIIGNHNIQVSHQTCSFISQLPLGITI